MHTQTHTHSLTYSQIQLWDRERRVLSWGSYHHPSHQSHSHTLPSKADTLSNSALRLRKKGAFLGFLAPLSPPFTLKPLSRINFNGWHSIMPYRTARGGFVGGWSWHPPKTAPLKLLLPGDTTVPACAVLELELCLWVQCLQTKNSLATSYQSFRVI